MFQKMNNDPPLENNFLIIHKNNWTLKQFSNFLFDKNSYIKNKY